jgi:hypothetical protein
LAIISKRELRFLIFNRFYAFILFIPYALGFVMYFFPVKFSICLFMNLTNLPCPACGLSRAFGELSHLHFIEAFSYNPMIAIYTLFFITYLVINFLPVNIKKKLYRLMLTHTNKVNLTFKLIFFIFVGFGVLRIADTFFHFINFKNVTPEITFLKWFLKNAVHYL